MMFPIQLDAGSFRAARERAGLTQTHLGDRLGISTSQVNRWENNPERLPADMLLQWMQALGLLPATGQAEAKPFEAGDPYEPVRLRKRQLGEMLKLQGREPPISADELIAAPMGLEDLALAFSELGRKPRILVAGKFDAGKSRLINTLLGMDKLPSRYQPTTRIRVLLRHAEDKPEWQREPVWIMKDGFDLADAENRQKCEEHRIVAGDFETLDRLGTHGGDSDRAYGEPAAALVYLDAPILKTCDIVDTPGLGHDENDSALASSAWSRGGILIYLSNHAGFIDSTDVQGLSGLLKILPHEAGDPPLRSLFLLASHMHDGIRDEPGKYSIESVHQRAAKRLEKLLSSWLEQRGEVTGQAIGADAIASRIFPWYAENPSRRHAFEKDLAELVGASLPRHVYGRLDEAVTAFKSQADEAYGREASHIETLLKARAEAETEFERLRAAEKARQKASGRKRADVEQQIRAAQAETAYVIRTEIAKMFSEDFIKSGIKDSRMERADAEKDALSLIVGLASSRLERVINENVEPIKDALDEYLEAPHIGQAFGNQPSVHLAFDARRAFIGASAGAASFGALAGWATVAAAGSNLGAYIAVAKAASLLSALGLGVGGGAAGAVGLVAALGGPAVVAAALALGVGVLAYSVFGGEWQTRLAKRIARHIEQQGLLTKLAERSDTLWDETLAYFQKGADGVEEAHRTYMRDLEARVKQPKEALEDLLRRIQRRRTFIASMPYAPLIQQQSLPAPGGD